MPIIKKFLKWYKDYIYKNKLPNNTKIIDVINYPGTLSDIENRDFIYVYVTCKNTGSTINAKLQTCHAI